MPSGERLLSFLTKMVVLTRKWSSSRGRDYLWDITMALLVDVPPFRDITRWIDFLTYTPIFHQCDLGLTVYTLREMQINVNIMVPIRDDDAVNLFLYAMNHLTATHVGYAINIRPLATHLARIGGDCTVRRRFMPSRRFVEKLRLEATMVHCLGCAVPVFCFIHHQSELARFRPITRAHSDDPEDLLYWFRFDDGTLAVFGNPFMPEIPAEPFPSVVANDTIWRYVDVALHPFVHALYPATIEQTHDIVRELWIPGHLRQFCVMAAKTRNGISDALIVSVGEFFLSEPEDTLLDIISDMVRMFRIMCAARRLNELQLADTLASRLATFAHPKNWRLWAHDSEFILLCVRRVSRDVLTSLCERYPPLFETVLLDLYRTIGAWTRDAGAKCVVLLSKSARDLFETRAEYIAVTEEVERLQRAATSMADVLCRAEAVGGRMQHGTPSRSKSAVATPPVAPGDEVGGVARTREEAAVPLACRSQEAICRTHRPLLRELAALHPTLEFSLIGSGILSDAGDLDLVVTVAEGPDGVLPTREEAYERVLQATGWRPCYEHHSKAHVAVLRGELRGVRVDAQVWRGVAHIDCRAEELTRDAVELWRAVETNTSSEDLALIRRLHAWFDCAGLKGHKLCRLSGVAVTCIAILLGCRTQAGRMAGEPEVARRDVSLRDPLTRLRDCLSLEIPFMNFDEMHMAEDRGGRPESALAVIVHGENCAARLAVPTTRHLLDTLRHALACPESTWLLPSTYTEWRHSTMVHCVRMIPLEKNAIARTLHHVVASFNGHPFIETLHIESEESGALLVLCTLDHQADVARYGFEATDRCVSSTATHVTIERRGRFLPLMLSPKGAVEVRLHEGVAVDDMLTLEDTVAGCVPNLPTLSCDVAGRFDARLWRWVL